MNPTRRAAILMLCLTSLIAYGPVLRLPFFWDDHQMIESNPHITRWSWENISHTFTHNVFNQESSYYRPAQTLLNMVDFRLYHFRSWGYHLTNLLIHLGSVLLLFLLLLRLGLRQEESLAAAMTFSVHPIIVQELMIIAGRAELMAAFFSLAAMWGAAQEKRKALGWSLSLAATLLALLSKESGIAAPVGIALCWWFQGRPWREFGKLAPHGLLSGAYMAFRFHYFPENLPGLSVGNALKFLAVELPLVIWSYLKLLVLPLGLHSHRLLPVMGWRGLLAALLLAGLVVLLVRKKHRLGLFAGAWFFIFLAPKFPLLLSYGFMLEHWVYLSAAGIYILAGKWAVNGRLWRKVLWGCWTVFLIGMAGYNIHIRRDDEKMYKRALQFSTSAYATYNLGQLYVGQGRYAEALPYLEKAFSRKPQDPMLKNALALTRHVLGDDVEALRLLNAPPQNLETWLVLAQVRSDRKEWDAALAAVDKAETMAPQSDAAAFAKAEIFRSRGEPAQALRFYERALGINPFHLAARNNAAILWAIQGEPGKAEEAWKFVLRADPANRGARVNLEKLQRQRAASNSREAPPAPAKGR